MENTVKNYFKITNREENHNGFQYVDGLNVLVEPFNDNANDYCGSGGLYFTDAENIFDFLQFGIYLRDVTLPVSDPDFKIVTSFKKWRANKIILGKRYNMDDPETFEYLVRSGASLEEKSWNISSWASQEGFVNILKYLKEKNLLNVNDYCNYNHFVNIAIENNRIETVKFYLDFDFFLDYNHINILDLYTAGKSEIFGLLVEKIKIYHPDKVRAMLKEACRLNLLPAIKLIIGEDKFSKDYYTAATIACDMGHLEIIKYFVEIGMDNEMVNLLSQYVLNHNQFVDILKYLISVGADININRIMLYNSFEKNNFEIVQFLAENGVSLKNINIMQFKNFIVNYSIEQLKKLFSWDIDREEICLEILKNASHKGNVEIMKYLVEIGVDPKCMENYAIRWASRKGQLEMVQYLVTLGVDLTAMDNFAFKWAAKHGHIDVVRCLVENGVNPRVDNDCAIKLADMKNHDDVVEYLAGLGAKI